MGLVMSCILISSSLYKLSHCSVGVIVVESASVTPGTLARSDTFFLAG